MIVVSKDWDLVGGVSETVMSPRVRLLLQREAVGWKHSNQEQPLGQRMMDGDMNIVFSK